MLSLVTVETILIVLGSVSVLLMSKMRRKRYTKLLIIYSGIGAIIGIVFSLYAELFNTPLTTIAIILSGILTAIMLTLSYMIAKNIWHQKEIVEYYDDGTPSKFYITGDKHRNFRRIKDFCHDMKTRKKDVIIILGDSGFNYYGDKRDEKLKSEISALKITLFCLHGNKENRPCNISTYGIRDFCGGKVYYEPKYPNIYFAIDGEIYTFEGKKYIVIGGAHSVDKHKCIEKNLPYFEDEMPNDEIKSSVEIHLAKMDYSIYGMLTHTCPLKYIPSEMFMSTRQNASHKTKCKKVRQKKRYSPDIDRSTEEWLESLEKKTYYTVWFCGHYHIDKMIDKIIMLYEEIRPLHLHAFGEEL